MFDNLEEAFSQLDAKPYTKFAKQLSQYRQALEKYSFTRRESMRLVESYAKFVYELAFESEMAAKEDEAHLAHGLEDDDSDDSEEDGA